MNLKETFDANIKEMIAKVNEINFLDEELYKWWLAQTYFMTMHSTDLLNFIGEHTKNSELKERWFSHADEEAGHHNMALRDLKNLGGKIEDYIELPETKGIYQRQWFVAKQADPNICFGWVLSLEGLAALINQDLISSIEAKFGKKATSFVRLHTQEDPEHLEKAFQSLEKIPGQELIIENLNNSSYFYLNMLQRIDDLSKDKNTKLAA